MIRRRQTSSAREAPGEAYGSPVAAGAPPTAGHAAAGSPGGLARQVAASDGCRRGAAGSLGAKKARQDSCCTAAFLNANPSTPQGPSKGMVSLLCSSQCSSSQQLHSAIAAGARAFCAAGAAGPDAAVRDVLDRLQEMHSCIVALDDNLDDCVPEESTADLLDCRQWLKHTQGWVLHLQKQVAGFCSDGHSTTSSMDDAASSSSNSTTAGTGASDCFEWRALCQDAADCLASVAQHMEPAGSSDGASSWAKPQQQAPRSAAAAVPHSSRLVAGRSCLSYSQFWSKKIAL